MKRLIVSIISLLWNFLLDLFPELKLLTGLTSLISKAVIPSISVLLLPFILDALIDILKKLREIIQKWLEEQSPRP